VQHLKGRDHFKNLGRWQENKTMILTKYVVMVWTEFNWLQVRTDDDVF
jgi:hypothetical protein